MNLSEQKGSKSKLQLPHEELLDRAELEAEQFNLPCPNLVMEDTYDGGGEDEVRGRHEDSVGEVAPAKQFVAGVVEGQQWRQGLCEVERWENDF